MPEDKIWNEAIEAFAERLMRFYRHQSGATSPASVEYHIKEIAKDMLRKGENDGS